MYVSALSATVTPGSFLAAATYVPIPAITPKPNTTVASAAKIRLFMHTLTLR